MTARLFSITALAAVVALSGCGKKEAATDAGSAATAANTTTAAPSLAPPARRDGLWEQTISTGGRSQTSSICFDKAMDKKMAVWGQAAGQDMCESTTITPKLGGWTFASTCDMGQSGKIVTNGEATGDFSSSYKVTATSTTTGASVPQMNGVHPMELTAVWKGACPADMKPGDMVLPGGMKMNILALTEQMAAMKK